MTELDILLLFYDEMRARGETRNTVFISIDEEALAKLNTQAQPPISLEQAHKLTDICIANEWLERTTIDPGYNFLSLTEAGLQMVLNDAYTKKRS